ncbi:MAG: cytochrome b/b6 domain-containing protein [Anaerolineales bacterium]|nr:cytochrome b/b6 domain-containing protein [Anaerolineales bacterium]
MNISKRNLLIVIGLLIVVSAFGIGTVLAQPEPASTSQASPLHPDFALLDSNGDNVLTSGKSISTMQTCGQCHDTKFIQQHAFHSDLGLSDYKNTKDFNASTGTFGKWDPLTYRYLSQTGDERLDMSTAEWLKLNGSRVVGGGPAETSREGQALTSISSTSKNYETAILNKNGNVEAWDWNASGTMEMNCFLCHIESPNTAARAGFIRSGWFGNANTATLLGLGIAEHDGSTDTWTWNPESFNENSELKADVIKIQDPTNANCAACHGEVHTDAIEPLTITACDLNNPQTATTGQVVASQKISESGINLSNKAEANRSWDIHAERQLQCTDCHFSINNPVYSDVSQKSQPSHLLYDPRKLDIGEYLKQPDHNFARGQSAQFTIAPELKGTMRRCESCHDAKKGHADWLPYIDTHMNAVACETCHIPQMYAPAIQSYDWTVLTTNNEPVKTCRGIEGDPNSVTSLVTGYKPVLLNRNNIDGDQLLAPYNLITTYYWVYDDATGNKRPVRLMDLESAYFEDSKYAADVMSTFDANKDGSLSDTELKIDSSAKEEAVKAKLTALGLNNPRIEGLSQPYSINHNVTRGENAVNDCKACHNDESRVSQPIMLSGYAPNGTLPVFDANNNVNASGEIVTGADGAVYYNPVPANDKMYVFGSSRVNWIDWLGALMFVGSLLGVVGHGTLRYFSSRKQAHGPVRTERVYMYEPYRRFWHWLQTASIVILLFTGLIIHRPDIFGAFSFRGVVTVHNVLAVILVVNAILSLFYHLATDRIREFIPRPYGFFDDAILQAKYYISGIFKGEGHPFEKRPDSRMNPIQKATYFGILNVLLPLQIITGALMWLVQKYPNILGGLPFLAPFHSLVAWTFATFILVHVYMTTTGATPLEAMRAMVTGYEEVEKHEHVEVKEDKKEKKEKK